MAMDQVFATIRSAGFMGTLFTAMAFASLPLLPLMSLGTQPALGEKLPCSAILLFRPLRCIHYDNAMNGLASSISASKLIISGVIHRAATRNMDPVQGEQYET